MDMDSEHIVFFWGLVVTYRRTEHPLINIKHIYVLCMHDFLLCPGLPLSNAGYFITFLPFIYNVLKLFHLEISNVVFGVSKEEVYCFVVLGFHYKTNDGLLAQIKNDVDYQTCRISSHFALVVTYRKINHLMADMEIYNVTFDLLQGHNYLQASTCLPFPTFLDIFIISFSCRRSEC